VGVARKTKKERKRVGLAPVGGLGVAGGVDNFPAAWQIDRPLFSPGPALARFIQEHEHASVLRSPASRVLMIPFFPLSFFSSIVCGRDNFFGIESGRYEKERYVLLIKLGEEI